MQVEVNKMQVSVETTQGLERKMKVVVPSSRIQNEVEKRLKQKSKTAKVPGFRPGNVPPHILKQQLGDSLFYDVANDLMYSSYAEAAEQEKLKPAGDPRFSLVKANPNEPLEFEVMFEVYPEVTLKSLNGAEIEKWVSKVEESDIDIVLERIRKQHMTWKAVERAAQKDDQVIIDFEGTIDGKPFAGNQAKNVPVVIGSKRMIEGFEEGLIDAKPQDEVTLNVKFPDEYHAKELAGKPAQFVVKIQQVMEGELPPLDEKFSKKMGVEGGVDNLRNEVRETMERELNQTIASKLKSKVLDKVLELNPIELPKALLNSEAEHLRKQMLHQFHAHKKDARTIPNLPLDIFYEQARRRVSLALILSEVIKEHSIKLDENRVRIMVEQIASAYEHPTEMAARYYNNQEKLAEIQSVVLEDQVVEKLLVQAKVIEKPISYAELMNLEGKR